MIQVFFKIKKFIIKYKIFQRQMKKTWASTGLVQNDKNMNWRIEKTQQSLRKKK